MFIVDSLTNLGL